MAPEFVARTGGSNRLSALPTGSRWVQAQPARVGSADYQSAGKPADSQTLAALIYGGR